MLRVASQKQETNFLIKLRKQTTPRILKKGDKWKMGGKLLIIQLHHRNTLSSFVYLVKDSTYPIHNEMKFYHWIESQRRIAGGQEGLLCSLQPHCASRRKYVCLYLYQMHDRIAWARNPMNTWVSERYNYDQETFVLHVYLCELQAASWTFATTFNQGSSPTEHYYYAWMLAIDSISVSVWTWAREEEGSQGPFNE